MLSETVRYPVGDRAGRDALAACTALVLVALILLRVAGGLWPDPLAVVPIALVAGPAVPFAGYLGAVLRVGTDEPTPPRFGWSSDRLRVGIRFLVVTGAYLVVPTVALLGSVRLLLASGGEVSANPFVGIAPTVALFVAIGFVYVLPAGLAAGVSAGVRAGLSRGPLRATASGAYFVAWTAAVSLVVLAWTALAAAGRSTPLAVVAAVGFAYAHVVAARLVGVGLARSPQKPTTQI